MEQGLQHSNLEVLRDHAGSRFASAKRWRQSWKQHLTVTSLVLSDALVALLVLAVAVLLQGIWGNGSLSTITIATTVPTVALLIGLRALMGLYPGYGLGAVEEVRRHTYAALAALAVLAVFAVALQVGGMLSRLVLVLFFSGLLVVAPFTRYLTKRVLRRAGAWGRPVVIFGSGQNGGRVRDRVATLLSEEWELGYDPVAVFDCGLSHPRPTRQSPQGQVPDGASCEEALTDVAAIARRRGVDTAVLAMPHTRREQLTKIIALTSVSFRHVLVVPNLSGTTNSAVVARDFAGTLAIEMKYNLLTLGRLG